MHELGMNDEFCSLYLAPQASRSARRLRAASPFGRDGAGATRGVHFDRSIGRAPHCGFVRRGVVP